MNAHNSAARPVQTLLSSSLPPPPPPLSRSFRCLLKHRIPHSTAHREALSLPSCQISPTHSPVKPPHSPAYDLLPSGSSRHQGRFSAPRSLSPAQALTLLYPSQSVLVASLSPARRQGFCYHRNLAAHLRVEQPQPAHPIRKGRISSIPCPIRHSIPLTPEAITRTTDRRHLVQVPRRLLRDLQVLIGTYSPNSVANLVSRKDHPSNRANLQQGRGRRPAIGTSFWVFRPLQTAIPTATPRRGVPVCTSRFRSRLRN